ncbi:hypothetical protein LOK49_LG13G00322 [Camellia lanceoleosa]|uniref:Uncharacterized protein n=1 Tax=Camellia lanceoleosa TaxID=1840588 RepID=A0ACC0FM73_9ERIC|nr:hypothetical protein LOK49_LG13G00322 [Camellia lanceoleosa]
MSSSNKKMKGVALDPSSYGGFGDSKARIKHQTLLQDYQDLQKKFVDMVGLDKEENTGKGLMNEENAMVVMKNGEIAIEEEWNEETAMEEEEKHEENAMEED